MAATLPPVTGSPINQQSAFAPQMQSANSQTALDPGFGNVDQVQQAWMARQQPQLDQQRQAEMARLKAQGITEDSEAWGRSMDTLNRSQTDANNQALLYGTQENNNIFNRGLQLNNQVWGQNNDRFNQTLNSNNQIFGQNQAAQQMALALRGQQANEAWQGGQLNLQQRQQMMNAQNNPYQQLMWLNSMQQGSPQFNQAGPGTDYTSAGMADYMGQLGNYNAQTAANNGMISGIGQVVGGIGSSAMNGSGSAANNMGGLLGGWFGG